MGVHRSNSSNVSGQTLISIVCPVYNEAECIPLFYDRLKSALDDLQGEYEFELLFTNNASEDGTLDVIKKLRMQDPSVQVITLSRNFGYQASVFAGLRNAKGSAIVVIDVDCEDPPELMPRFIEEWERGYDVVYGERGKRPEFIGLQWIRKTFYRITRLIADYDFVLYMAEFALVSSHVRDAMLSNASTFPFLRAELGFVGFNRLGIPYDRDKRIRGKSHYNFGRMVRFAVAGILSSTTFPLRLVGYVGVPLILLNLCAVVYGFFGDLQRVLPFVTLLDLTFVLMALVILSIYLARNYKNGVRHPIFIVDWKRSLVNGHDLSEPDPVERVWTTDRG